MPKKAKLNKKHNMFGGHIYTEEYIKDPNNILKYNDDEDNVTRECIKDHDTGICYKDPISLKEVSPDNAYIIQNKIVDINNLYEAIIKNDINNLFGNISILDQFHAAIKYHEKQTYIREYMQVIMKYQNMFEKMKKINLTKDKQKDKDSNTASQVSKTGKNMFFMTLIPYTEKNKRIISDTIDKIQGVLRQFPDYVFNHIVKELKHLMKEKIGDGLGEDYILNLAQYIDVYTLCYETLFNFINLDFSFQSDEVWSKSSIIDIETYLDNKFNREFAIYPLTRNFFLEYFRYEVNKIILMDKTNNIRKIDWKIYDQKTVNETQKNKRIIINNLLCFTFYYYVYNVYVINLSNVVYELEIINNTFAIHMSEVIKKLINDFLDHGISELFDKIKNKNIMYYETQKTSERSPE